MVGLKPEKETSSATKSLATPSRQPASAAAAARAAASGASARRGLRGAVFGFFPVGDASPSFTLATTRVRPPATGDGSAESPADGEGASVTFFPSERVVRAGYANREKSVSGVFTPFFETSSPNLPVVSGQ